MQMIRLKTTYTMTKFSNKHLDIRMQLFESWSAVCWHFTNNCYTYIY